MAVRLAIGASRGQLLAQLLIESLMLSAAGAALGLLLAIAMIRSLLGFLPQGETPLLLRATPDPALGLFRHIHVKENLTEIVLLCVLVAGDCIARSPSLVSRFAVPILATVSTVCVLTILSQILFADAPKLFVYFQF